MVSSVSFSVGTTLTATGMVASVAQPEIESEALPEMSAPWITLVWDDPVNTIDYVIYVFRSYFGYTKEEAHQLTYQVHNEGRAVVSCGPMEDMQRDTEAMHKFGLMATFTQDCEH